MSPEVIATLAVGIPAAAAAIAAYLLSRAENTDLRDRRLINDMLQPVRERLIELSEEIESHDTARRQVIEDLLAPLRERLIAVEREIREMKRNGR